MLYARSVAAGEDSDHVEAQGVDAWFVVRQVLCGEGADGRLLSEGYGFEWIAVGGRAAELDFHEDEGVLIADYEVDLAAPRPVVAFDERVAPRSQVA